MKIQFSTSSILWATAFVGIAITGFAPLWQSQHVIFEIAWDTLLFIAWMAIVAAPIYLPVVFAAYAIGRIAITWRMVLAFAAMQGAAYFAKQYWDTILPYLR